MPTVKYCLVVFILQNAAYLVASPTNQWSTIKQIDSNNTVTSATVDATAATADATTGTTDTAIEAFTQDESSADEEFRTFYGTHAQQLEELATYLHLKGFIKSKAYDCKRIMYCERGKLMRWLWNGKHAPLMQQIAAEHHGILGAFAAGWSDNNQDCNSLFPKCEEHIQVVTQTQSCEGCF